VIFGSPGRNYYVVVCKFFPISAIPGSVLIYFEGGSNSSPPATVLSVCDSFIVNISGV